MTLRFFSPDPDADEYGYGWFEDDYGESTYGFDPDLARSLDVKPSRIDEANAAIEDRAAQVRQVEQAPVEQAPLETFARPPPGATAPGAPPAAPPAPPEPDPAPASAPTPEPEPEEPEPSGWTVEIGDARLATVNNNPGNLRYAGQAGAEQGEGGFARFGSPAAGMSALVRQVGLDRDRGDTVATFVSGYAPGGVDGNNPEKYARDLAGILGVSIDTPLAELDPNEVAKGVARIESGTTASLGQVGPQQLATGEGLPPMGPPGAPPAAMAQGLPPEAVQMGGMAAPPGMSLGSVTLQGVDEDPAVTEARMGAVANAYDQQQQALARAASERMAAEIEKARLQQEDAIERSRVAQERLAYQQAAQQATEREIDQLVTRPLQQVDPARVFRQMSFGRALSLALGSFLGGASGRFDPVRAIDTMVERDIKAQMENIRLGEDQAKSRLSVNTRRLGSLEQGIAMTKAEIREAATKHLQALQLGRDAQTLGAARDQALADNELKKQQEIGKIFDSRLTKKVSQFVPTPRPTPVIPASPIGVEEPPEIKRARVQQFQMLKPNEQKALLEPIGKAVQGTAMAERGLKELFDLHGVVERGGQLYVERDGKAVPLSQAELNDETIGDVGVFGGNLNPANFTVTDEGLQRRQRLNAAWTELQKSVRSEMPTEPPREFDELVRQAAKPRWDSQIPAALQSAYDALRERRRLIESTSDPNAWAYYQWRNPPQGGVRARTLQDAR
jgi:hypothetical protein